MAQLAPLVAVCGATGAQGGGVVEALLADGGFRVRGLTRHAQSNKAQRLRARGVEAVVHAEFDDVASLERAFQGASRDAALLLHACACPACTFLGVPPSRVGAGGPR